MNNSKEIDEYLKILSATSQEKIGSLLSLVHKLFPQAEEAMKYGIPGFVLQNKNLVHFAAYKKHIGLYPGPETLLLFSEELSSYSVSKGAVQFPLDKPLPLALIKKIIKERAKEILMASK